MIEVVGKGYLPAFILPLMLYQFLLLSLVRYFVLTRKTYTVPTWF